MQNLVFPSGLSVQRAKKRAKELVKSKQAKNQTDALDAISLKEVNKPWALAMAQLQQNLDSSNSIKKGIFFKVQIRYIYTSFLVNDNFISTAKVSNDLATDLSEFRINK